MGPLNFTDILKIVGDFGTLGLVIYLWWADNRRIATVMDQNKTDMNLVFEQYKKDMIEQREMYKSNVSLCKDFASVTNDLRDIVTLNIQTMTECKDSINQNQYCPVIRISKKKARVALETIDDGG
jgi:hypothetical protein